MLMARHLSLVKQLIPAAHLDALFVLVDVAELLEEAPIRLLLTCMHFPRPVEVDQARRGLCVQFGVYATLARCTIHQTFSLALSSTTFTSTTPRPQ